MQSHRAEVCGSEFESSAPSSARKNHALDIERERFGGSAEVNFNPNVCKVYYFHVYGGGGFEHPHLPQNRRKSISGSTAEDERELRKT